MAVLQITQENFDREVLSSPKPVLLDFWADWCGPCGRLAPVVDQIAAEHPEIAVGKIHVDQQRKLARDYRVMSIPTLMVVKEGQVTARVSGVQSKEDILQLL